MTTKLEPFTTHVRINPNPNSSPKRPSMASSSPSLLNFSPSLRFHALHRSPRQSQLTCIASLKGLGGGTRFLSSYHHQRMKTRLAASLEASHEDLKHTEIEVEEGKSEARAKESHEEWERMLELCKEKAIKMQGISQEAFEVYSKRATIILKDIAEKLKVQAEKTRDDFIILAKEGEGQTEKLRHDLTIKAKEIGQEGKEYLSAAAEKSPEEMKDIIETFTSSTDDLKEVSKVRDFYLGIPYGAILSVGGFLSFMVTGSTSAIRFGVILGGTLLALSISSLRSWKKGESSALALKGQAALAGVIFLRELRLFFQRPAFSSFFPSVISGAMVLFYLYRIRLDGDENKGESMEIGSNS